MKLMLSNTLTGKKEEFVPIDPSLVTIYSCGPTVYSEPHVGNMRPYFVADLLRSTIRYVLGYEVKHVVNITDVGHLVNDTDDGEDKLEKGSRREGLSAWEVAAKYESHFVRYMEELHISPFIHPRATDYIHEQIEIITMLRNNSSGDLTYIIPGDGIYMDTSLVSDYGKLIGKNYQKHLDGLQAGARVDGEGKKNPTDFALRKFTPLGEVRQMEWIFDGPRAGQRVLVPGEKGVYSTVSTVDRSSLTALELQTVGFPGRHIECSAMSRACLGDRIDIHTGGVDHIPIHHTDEIAQSEHSFCTHGQRVQFWLHTQFLNINGQKVSKSLGDDLSVPGIQARGFDMYDLRMFFLQAHYKSFQDFTREGLEAAKKTRKNLKKSLTAFLSVSPVNDITSYPVLCDALLDDLNTPKLLVAIQSMIGSLDSSTASMIARLDQYVLKLGLFEVEESQEIPDEIMQLAAQRRQAKQDKNRAESDRLRELIGQAGYVVNDAKDGTYTIGVK